MQMVVALSCGAFEKHTLALKDVRQMHAQTFYKGYIKYLSEVDDVFQKVVMIRIHCASSPTENNCSPKVTANFTNALSIESL